MLDNMIFDRTEADVAAGDTDWVPTWESGNIDTNGRNASASNRCRTVGFKKFGSLGGLLTVFVPSGFRMTGRRYTGDTADTYDGKFPPGSSWIRGTYYVQMPPNERYRFVLQKEDATAFSPSEAAAAGVKFLAINVKGRYNCTDLNRVGAAINSVTARLYAEGYGEPVTLRTDFAPTDDVRVSELSPIVESVKMIRGCLGGFEDTPNAPDSIRFLDYDGANAIEKILYDADLLLDKLEDARFFAGDLYSGEV